MGIERSVLKAGALTINNDKNDNYICSQKVVTYLGRMSHYVFEILPILYLLGYQQPIY